MTKLPTTLFGDVRANYIFSRLVLIKWLLLGRQNKKKTKIIANQRKEIELDLVGIIKFLYAQGVFIF